MRGLGLVFRPFSVSICLLFLSSGLQSQTRVERSSESVPLTDSQQKRSGVSHNGFSLGDLPLQFEENLGQADSRARFLARGRGYTLLLNSDGPVLNLVPAENQRTSKRVSMHLLGAQAVRPVGREQSVTRTNYYIGKSPSDWHLNVPSYHSVIYPGLYWGIDLVYHGNGNQLEYDFLVSPGADPGQVRMQFDGGKLRLENDRLAFEGETRISLRALKAFQWINGQKKPVDAAWEIHDDQVSIRLGDYDRGQQLVIDPIFFYGGYIGGTSNDAAVSVVPGPNGTFYVALSTSSPYIEEPTLPTSGCNQQQTPQSVVNCNPNPNADGTDTLIVKLDASNSPTNLSSTEPFNSVDTASLYPTLVSATYIGGTTGVTEAHAMVADSGLNLYVTGATTKTTPTSFPQLGPTLCSNNCTGFVVKLNSSLVATYSSLLPALGNSVAVDSSGDAYVTGAATAGSLTIPPADVAFQSSVTAGSALTSGTNAFLMELGPTGSLLFASYIGGSGTDQGNGIAVSGNTVYIAGQTASSDFPTSSGAYQTAYGGGGSGGQGDAFVVGITNPATAPALAFSTFLGGASDDFATSIALDPTGNLVVAGSSASSGSGSGAFPIAPNPTFEFTRLVTPVGTTGAPPAPVTVALPTTIPAGSQAAFVTGLSADGSSLRFTDFLDGATQSVSSASAVAIDPAGVIYVTGGSNAVVNGTSTSSSTDFMNGNATTDNWQGFQAATGNNVFFAQIDPTGSHLLQATITGGTGDDAGAGLSISGPQAVVGVASIVGTTGNTDVFEPAASSVLYPVSPPVPAGKTTGAATGFFAQETLAGFCNMQLTSQAGAHVSFQGTCASGTTSGTVYVTNTSGTQLQTAPITISGGIGTATFDLSGVQTGTTYVLNFTFSPVGAIGGVGTCQISDGILSGCSVVTNGGGGGTLFNVTAGTLAVALTCGPQNSCVPAGGNTPSTYYVFPGPAVTLDATITNGVPNTVTWGAVNTPQGTLVPPPAPTASATFTPGLTGGTTVITATAAADGTTKGNLTLVTLETPILTLAVNNSGTLSYGQTITANVSASGLSSTPSGSFTYVVDGGTSINGTLSAGGVATITLPRLGAGNHDLTVNYPSNYQAGGFFTAATKTLNFTIAPATLTVQATNASADFGQDIPALTYTITGFQYDDSQSTIGGAPTETTTATKGSPVGQYPITITQGTLGTNSSVQNYSFVFQNGTLTITSLGAAPQPIISLQSGTYTAPQTVSITDSLAGATIHFTTDGSAPTTSSTAYTGPITVNRSETIQAAAIAQGHDLSAIASAAFVLAPPSLSATSLAFGSVVEGQASAAQPVTLTNQGKNALTGIAVAIAGANAGDFTIQSGSTCGSSLQAGASCNLPITFAPTETGSRNASLTFSYTGIGSPESVALGGAGVGPLSITTPPSQLVAGTTYQFTATGPASWTASAGTITSSGLFTAPNPPPDPATVTITATSLSSPPFSVTSQVTIVPAPAVTVPSNITLSAGGTVSIPLSIAAGTGIPGELLAFACTPATLPTGVNCTFTPNPVVNAAGGTTATLNLSSGAINAMAAPDQPGPWNKLPLGGSVVLAACCLLLGSRRLRHAKMFVLLWVFISAGLVYLTACGTSGSFKTKTQEGFATGTYEIKVTVTGASPGSPDYNQVVTIFSVTVDIQ